MSEPPGGGATSKEPAAQGEVDKQHVERIRVTNFPLHLKNELLAPLFERWQRRVRISVNGRRWSAVFYGPEKADVEEAVRQYHDLLQKAEVRDRAIARLYAEEGAVEVSVRRFGNAKNVACCARKDHKVISSYSWNTANASEPYSVPGRLRTYSKPMPYARKENHKQGEEEEEAEKEAAGSVQPQQQQQQVIEIIRMACRARHPDFSLDRYDIVTNRNNLRKIFCWACLNRSRWRINIEKISETTVSLSRFDLEDSDIAKRNQVIADEFEAACCGYSQESYRALIQCNMAGINFLVQCEVDCAMPASSSSSDPTSTPEDKLCNIDAEVHEIAGLRYKLTSEPLDPPFVELKTCHPDRFKRPHEHIEYLLDTWFQSYLAGVDMLVFGIKDSKCGIANVEECSPLDSFLPQIKGKWDPSLQERAMKALAKTMRVVRWIKEKMANEPVGAKFYLLAEPWDRCALKLYRRPGDVPSCFPEVASTACLIEELSTDEAWQVLTDLLRDVIPDPRAPLQSLLRADPALFLPLLQQRLSGQQAE